MIGKGNGMTLARRTSRHGETVELEQWADGTYVITLDGERVATVLNANDFRDESLPPKSDCDVANELFLAL